MNTKIEKKKIPNRWAVSLLWLATVGLLAAGCDVLGDDSGYTCENECKKEWSVCDPSGGKISCEGPNSRGCYYWGAIQTCEDNKTCKSGQCICLNPCQDGDSMCFSSTEQTLCQGPDADGCTSWGDPASCGEGKACKGNSCECQNPCEENDSICDASGKILHCQGPDADGCYSWGSAEDCPEHQKCSDGKCSCENPCQLPDVMCYQMVAKIHCAGPDANQCFFWDSANLEQCPQDYQCKAEVNDCIPATPPECAGVNECDYEGQMECKTDVKYRGCKYNEQGCLIWDCGS